VQPEERVLDRILGALLVAEQQRRDADESNRVHTEQVSDQVGCLASRIVRGIVGVRLSAPDGHPERRRPNCS
jgi:hypothetical protein